MKECLNCERPYEVAEGCPAVEIETVLTLETKDEQDIAEVMGYIYPADGFCSFECAEDFDAELRASRDKSIERGLLTIDGAPAIFEPQLPDTPISKQSTINSVISSLLKAKGD